MIWLLLLLPALWLLFNLVAPYVPLIEAERVSPGRLPRELLARGEAKYISFYIGPTRFSYAYSAWAPGKGTVVIFNREFFRRAPPDLVKWVVGHELGHAAAGHHRWRWAAIVSGAVLIPWVRRRLEKHERSADTYALLLTGIKKERFAQFLKG